LPKNINFILPESFTIDLKEIALTSRNWKGFIEYDLITPSYELGYIFGMFLGDGTTSLKYYKRHNKKTNIDSRTLNGSLSWSFGLNEGVIAKKLTDCLNMVFGKFSNTSTQIQENKLLVLNRSNVVTRLFISFGKKHNKLLPEQYKCSNKEYLKGLVDGLVDSDGSSPEKGGIDPRTGFGNTSPYLAELFMWAFYTVNGYYPSVQYKKPTAGGLKGCNVENCKPGFILRSVAYPEYGQTQSYQINRIYSKIEDCEIEIPTYDLEIDCPTHSFIADNTIVHNSVCSTRTQTGCGVPQLSAIVNACEVKKYRSEIKIIADGGIKNSGDVIKSLAAGADFVMIGNLFAGTTESAGKIYREDNFVYKIYRGLASVSAQLSWKGFAKSVEGELTRVPYKGPVKEIFDDLIAGMLSGMSYQNALNLSQLRENAVFIRQTSAGLIESSPHALRRR